MNEGIFKARKLITAATDLLGQFDLKQPTEFLVALLERIHALLSEASTQIGHARASGADSEEVRSSLMYHRAASNLFNSYREKVEKKEIHRLAPDFPETYYSTVKTPGYVFIRAWSIPRQDPPDPGFVLQFVQPEVELDLTGAKYQELRRTGKLPRTRTTWGTIRDLAVQLPRRFSLTLLPTTEEQRKYRWFQERAVWVHELCVGWILRRLVSLGITPQIDPNRPEDAKKLERVLRDPKMVCPFQETLMGRQRAEQILGAKWQHQLSAIHSAYREIEAQNPDFAEDAEDQERLAIFRTEAKRAFLRLLAERYVHILPVGTTNRKGTGPPLATPHLSTIQSEKWPLRQEELKEVAYLVRLILAERCRNEYMEHGNVDLIPILDPRLQSCIAEKQAVLAQAHIRRKQVAL